MPAAQKKLIVWSTKAERSLARAKRTLVRSGAMTVAQATNSAVVRYALGLVAAPVKAGRSPRERAAAPRVHLPIAPTPEARAPAPDLGRGRDGDDPHRVAWHLPDGERIALTCIAHNPTWKPLTASERTVCTRLRAKGFLDPDHALTFLGRRVAEARVGWLSIANVEGMRERLRAVLATEALAIEAMFAHPKLESGGEECIRVALRLLHDAGEVNVQRGLFSRATPCPATRPTRRSSMRR